MHTNQTNHNSIFHLYYHNPNKSITNIETNSSTNRKIFSIDQSTQYIPIGWDVSTNNTKIKIKDGI